MICEYCGRKIEKYYVVSEEHIQSGGLNWSHDVYFCSKSCIEQYIKTFKPMSKYLCKVRFVLVEAREIVLDEKEFDCL